MQSLLDKEWKTLLDVSEWHREERTGVPAVLQGMLHEARVRGMPRSSALLDGCAGMLKVRRPCSLVSKPHYGGAARVRFLPGTLFVVRLRVLLPHARRRVWTSTGAYNATVCGRVVPSASCTMLTLRFALLEPRGLVRQVLAGRW